MTSARTIDGMRVRGAETPRLMVAQRVPAASSQRTARPQQVRRAQSSSARLAASRRRAKEEENLGLTRNNLAKQRARLKANEDFLSPVSTLNFDLSDKELKPDYSLRKRDVAASGVRRKVGSKKKKGGKAKKVIIGVFAVLLIGGGGLALWGNGLIQKLTGGREGLFEAISALGSNVKLKADKNGRTNILVFGTSGYSMDGSVGGGEEHDGSQLTDSIMVVSLDQETKDIAMASLPRDLYVGNTCTATGKVNEVFFCANLYGDDEEGGADALKNTVSEIFGIDIQYRVHVDWSALIQIVDGLGGITVTLDEDIEDDWTGTYIHAGEAVTLNGEQALGLARARHGTEMGDFTRGNSQQKILTAIQAKLVNNGIDLGTALNLVDVVGDNVRMNFSLEEMKSIYYIAKDMSLDNMRQVPLIDYGENIYYLSTAEMNGISYVVPMAGIRNYSSIQSYVAKMFSSNPAVREDAEIVVLNGSGVGGVAMAEQNKLNREGYTSVEIDDAPEGEWTEKYYLYNVSTETPGTVKAMEERYGVSARSGDELPEGVDKDGVDIVIVLGSGE